MQCRTLVDDPLFKVQVFRASRNTIQRLPLPRCAILGVVSGPLTLNTSAGEWVLGRGDFCLLPSALDTVDCRLSTGTEYLLSIPGGRQNLGSA